ESSSHDGVRVALNEFLAQNPGIDSKNLSQLLTRVSKAFRAGFSLGENGSLTAPPSKWDYPGSVFFCLTVITTIGYGNLSPTTPAGQSVCCVYALIGIPMLAVFLSGIADRVKGVQLRLHRLSCWRNRGRLPKAASSVVYTLIGLVIFFIVPASVFTATEGWSLEVGVYYSLVTLSTIGFGDYVAGQTYSSDVYRFSLAVWIFLGMLFVSGLINAVQVGMEKGTQIAQSNGDNQLVAKLTNQSPRPDSSVPEIRRVGEAGNGDIESISDAGTSGVCAFCDPNKPASASEQPTNTAEELTLEDLPNSQTDKEKVGESSTEEQA
ncbi:hypothetical protein BOX15_Mlig006444g1, partial [Macrostomum lignano]